MCLARVDDNEIAIAAKGGLDVLVLVMHAHKASAAVMRMACGALRILAVNGKPPLRACQSLWRGAVNGRRGTGVG